MLSLTDYEYFQNVLADIVTISLVGKEIGLGRSVVEKKVSEEEIGQGGTWGFSVCVVVVISVNRLEIFQVFK